MDFTVLENGFIKISNFLPQELFDQLENSDYWKNEFSTGDGIFPKLIGTFSHR